MSEEQKVEGQTMPEAIEVPGEKEWVAEIPTVEQLLAERNALKARVERQEALDARAKEAAIQQRKEAEERRKSLISIPPEDQEVFQVLSNLSSDIGNMTAFKDVLDRQIAQNRSQIDRIKTELFPKYGILFYEVPHIITEGKAWFLKKKPASESKDNPPIQESPPEGKKE